MIRNSGGNVEKSNFHVDKLVVNVNKKEWFVNNLITSH